MLFRRGRGTVTDYFVVELLSSVPGLHFTARFTVEWTPFKRRNKPGNLRHSARYTVQETAQQVARLMTVPQLAVTEHRINAELATLHHTRHGQVRIDAAQVMLSVDPATADTAAEYDRKLREEQREDQLQRRELDRLQRFRDTVLRDRASAMSYWFMRHPDRTDETAYDHIEKLVEKVADHDPAKRSLLIAKILDSFIDKLTPEDKRELMDILAKALTLFGQHQDALRIADIMADTDPTVP